jgi:SAM-dependent methyltransferase
MNSCRVCDGTSFSRELEVRGYLLKACGTCGYVQVRDVPSQDDLRVIYGAQYFEKSKYRNDEANYREQQRRMRFLQSAGLSDCARVLDFGCGTGDFIAQARQRFNVYGADVSKEAIDKARNTYPDLSDQFFVTDLAGHLPEDVRDLDAVVAWDVIEHLEQPIALLKSLTGRLKPGGVLAISTPNIGAWFARASGARWPFMTPPEHLGFFSPGSIGLAFDQVGVRLDRWMSKGKWVNFGFLVYKARRVFPEYLSESFVSRMGTSALGRICLYAPTGDVLYAIGRLGNASRSAANTSPPARSVLLSDKAG